MIYWTYSRGEDARPPYGLIMLLAVVMVIMAVMVRGWFGYSVAALIVLDMIATTPRVIARERRERRMHSVR